MHCRAGLFVLGSLVTWAATGCQSPYHADRGALFGGLMGAGAGALVGDALGNTGAGAAIGAGLGALTGATVGQEMDDMEAQNRALIASQLGRQVRAGAVTIDDVVMMSQAGVDEELIVNHIRAHGMVRPPGTSDLITLNSQDVGKNVIKAMQEPPPAPKTQTVVYARPAPRPVIIEEYRYGPSYCAPPPPVYYHHAHGYRPRRAGVNWGMSFAN